MERVRLHYPAPPLNAMLGCEGSVYRCSFGLFPSPNVTVFLRPPRPGVWQIGKENLPPDSFSIPGKLPLRPVTVAEVWLVWLWVRVDIRRYLTTQQKIWVGVTGQELVRAPDAARARRGQLLATIVGRERLGVLQPESRSFKLHSPGELHRRGGGFFASLLGASGVLGLGSVR